MPIESIAARMNQTDLGVKSDRELRALIGAMYAALTALAAKLDASAAAGTGYVAEVNKSIVK